MYSEVTVIIFGNIIDILGLNKKTFRAPTWSPDKMIVGDLSTQRTKSSRLQEFIVFIIQFTLYLIDDIRISMTPVLYPVQIINCGC